MRELSSKEFDHWIDQMCFDCKKGTGIYPSMLDYLFHYPIKRNDNYNIRVVGSDTIVHSQWIMTKYITDFRLTNYISGKTGWARMSDYDEWSNKYALGIAWARYCGYEIPKIKNYLSKEDIYHLKTGTILSEENGFKEITFVGVDPICPDYFLAYWISSVPVIRQFKIKENSYFIVKEGNKK